MQQQRIVHLSDTHLTVAAEALLGLHPLDTLKLVVQEIAQLQPQPNAILVTGDMAERGRQDEYKLFTEQLKPLNTPVYWLPGNHDDAATMRSVVDGKCFFDNKTVQLGAWQLILLNSQVIDQSYGHISTEEFAFLSTELRKHATRPTLVALHHTPCSSCVDPNCQLDNREEFLALLKTHDQVNLVLAGHTHQADTTHAAGLHVFSAPSTFAQVSHPVEKSQLVAEDFFASHQLSASRVGYRVFDLGADGQYSDKLHWIEC